MDSSAIQTDDTNVVFSQWCFQEKVKRCETEPEMQEAEHLEFAPEARKTEPECGGEKAEYFAPEPPEGEREHREIRQKRREIEQELRQERSEIERGRRELMQQRLELEREHREFSVRQSNEQRRMDQQKQLFEMKWKILEEELKKLANEKLQLEKQKNFYRCVCDFEEREKKSQSREVRGEMFFTGVENKQSLKKRYKDLIKIYHPDNLDGDTGTIQEINREFDRLSKLYD